MTAITITLPDDLVRASVIDAPVDEQQDIVQAASGKLERQDFTAWLRTRIVERKDN